MELIFTWDPNKAAINLHKHGISFDEAIEVFKDPHHFIMENYFFAEETEQRYQAVGMTTKLLVLTVVFAERSNSPESQVIHLINARKADHYEEQLYADASQA